MRLRTAFDGSIEALALSVALPAISISLPLARFVVTGSRFIVLLLAVVRLIREYTLALSLSLSVGAKRARKSAFRCFCPLSHTLATLALVTTPVFAASACVSSAPSAKPRNAFTASSVQPGHGPLRITLLCQTPGAAMSTAAPQTSGQS